MNNNYQLQTLQTIPVARTEEVASSSGRLAEITYALAENAAFTDRLKAALAKQVMDNTGSPGHGRGLLQSDRPQRARGVSPYRADLCPAGIDADRRR